MGHGFMVSGGCAATIDIQIPRTVAKGNPNEEVKTKKR
jgi:hypothetical protein